MAPEGRGRVPLIRDPAYAVAVAKCWLARTENPYALSAHHPEECGFCEVPLETLIGSLIEFGSWSGMSYRPDRFDPANPVTLPWRTEIESFARLPAEEQTKLVQRAQGYLPEED